MKAADAQLLAERLRRQVEAHAFSTVGSLTISIGGTAYRHGDSAASLFARADEALYRAKASGRNAVVITSEAEAATAPAA